MEDKQHILEIIENNLESMTDLEKEIARYFLESQTIQEDLSSLQVTQQLHISQAALTRFAKKCGFKGYREFKFQYQQQVTDNETETPSLRHDLSRRVMRNYISATRCS